MTTITREIERMDLLLSGEWNSWDDLAQVGKALVEIEYEFEPGQREIMRPDPNDCQEGFPASLRIYRVQLAAPLHFAGDVSETTIKAGTKLWDSHARPVRIERISPSQVEQLEHEELKGIAASRYERRAA